MNSGEAKRTNATRRAATAATRRVVTAAASRVDTAAARRAATDAVPHVDAAAEAMQLMGRWQRVTAGHLALAAGCACSFGASIDMREFDEFILDYLVNRHAQSAQRVDYIRRHAGIGADRPGSLRALLRALATPATPGNAIEANHAAVLLGDISVSIASIEEQHGGAAGRISRNPDQ